jgi:hypothetical protein
MMKELSLDDLYECYANTTKRITSDLQTLSNEEIEYILFEQFCVDVWSFFHDDNLGKLHTAVMISDKAVLLSQNIRSLWLELEPTAQKTSWSTGALKNDPKWSKLLSMCSDLQSLLTQQDE